MNDDDSRLTRWALGELSALQAAEFETELHPLRRSEAEAHRDFCERAVTALVQDRRGLPSRKRAAILAAFAAREAAAHRRRARRTQLQRVLQLVLAVSVLCGVGWILVQMPGRTFVRQSETVKPPALTARMSPGELDVANYRLAALTAYLKTAEARLQAAELAAESPRNEEPARQPKAPAPPPPAAKPAPEAQLQTPFSESFPIAQIRLPL